MADLPIQIDGDDSFALGLDGFVLPTKLLPGQYAGSMNTINRGGMVQTRPGSRHLPLHLPRGNLQGFTFFTPSGSNPALVVAANGQIYVSYAPFTSYFVLLNITFSPYSKYVSWASCIQSTYYDEAGELQYLDEPKAVLMMQDGNTRAAYWDGVNSGHLNPSESPTIPEVDGFNETPVGLWMAWSNNRLWVTRGSQVFASDIGNPLKFAEATYINEGRAFYLPGACTGVAETPDRKGILCFTQSNGSLLQSAIQDRTLWLTTPDFQQIAIPDVGCVAPRSIVQQYGMLWWQSARGLINLDDALRTHISSELKTRDLEMFQSKYAMDSDISLACGSAIENFLLQAIPVEEGKNTRILVMDQSPTENASAGVWPSFWTGWRPVEFARGSITNADCIFILSYDFDGETRIWQLFSTDKTDSGIPITSYVVTKQHLMGNRDYKKFRFAEIEMQALSGQTAVSVSVAGIRGGFQKVMEKDIYAINGQVYSGSSYTQDSHIAGTRQQTRILRTEDFPPESECNAECVENDIKGLVDKAFSLLITWSGVAGISCYRIQTQTWPSDKTTQGTCEENETEPRLVTPDGCGMFGIFSTQTPFEKFYATATVTYLVRTIYHFAGLDPIEVDTPLSFTKSAESVISQLDADRKALATARFYINQYLSLA